MARWEPDAQGRLAIAALQLFAEQGYEQTTVADVAARAGVTERTFYRYFADKREVLFSGNPWVDRIIAAIVADEPGAAPLDLVTAGLLAGAPLLEERREFALQRAAVLAATPSLQERELLKMIRLASSIAEALRNRGVAAPEARMAAETGVSLFRVAFDNWIAGHPPGRSLGEHIDEAAAALRKLAAARPQ